MSFMKMYDLTIDEMYLLKEALKLRGGILSKVPTNSEENPRLIDDALAADLCWAQFDILVRAIDNAEYDEGTHPILLIAPNSLIAVLSAFAVEPHPADETYTSRGKDCLVLLHKIKRKIQF